jgi:Myosin head (motor domain)
MTSSPFAGTTSSGSGSASEGTASSKSNANVATPSKAVGQTVATRFTGSLHELTEVLARTQTRFVRCVKTNGLLKPQVFEKPSVLRQLKVVSCILSHSLCSAYLLNRVLTCFRSFFFRFVCIHCGGGTLRCHSDTYCTRSIAVLS